VNFSIDDIILMVLF